jgi:sigma-B regulation protein RsbU (phosphoserine phosphatase)
VVRPASETVVRLVPADPEPATGLMADFRYTRYESTFAPGDLFFGYTDGVLEAADAAGQFYGEARLGGLLLRTRGRPGNEVCETLVRELEAYSGRSVFEDDVCVVAVESTGKSPATNSSMYEI